MAFVKVINDCYIIGIGKNQSESGGIMESEYNQISELFKNKPPEPDGYQYKLRADNLEWEMVELPEPIDENAEISDYENALSDLGVRFGD